MSCDIGDVFCLHLALLLYNAQYDIWVGFHTFPGRVLDRHYEKRAVLVSACICCRSANVPRWLAPSKIFNFLTTIQVIHQQSVNAGSGYRKLILGNGAFKNYKAVNVYWRLFYRQLHDYIHLRLFRVPRARQIRSGRAFGVRAADSGRSRSRRSAIGDGPVRGEGRITKKSTVWWRMRVTCVSTVTVDTKWGSVWHRGGFVRRATCVVPGMCRGDGADGEGAGEGVVSAHGDLFALRGRRSIFEPDESQG